jgi:hypothetical protein
MTPPESPGQQQDASAELSQLLRDFLMPAIPATTVLETIRASGNEKIRVQELMPLLQTNPSLAHFLMKLTFLANKVKDWRAEVPETVDHSVVITERILSLLGKNLVRNITASIALNRLLGANLPRKSKDTSLNIDYAQQLPFAIGAQEYCLDRKLMHADMAFNAGLHYDLLSTLLTKKKASQDQKAAVKEAFDEGFAIARVAYKVGQKMRKIRYDRYVFAGALLVPAGKVIMGMLFPKELKEKSWAQLVADCDKHPKGRFEALATYESRRLPLTYSEISGLLASFGETLRPVERAISCVSRPYYLDSIDPGLASLAGLWSVSRSAAQAKDGKFKPTPFEESFLIKSNLTAAIVKNAAAETRAEKVG